MDWRFIFGIFFLLSHSDGEHVCSIFGLSSCETTVNPSDSALANDSEVAVAHSVFDAIREEISYTCELSDAKFFESLFFSIHAEPNVCSLGKFCNSTMCLELGSPSNIFTHTVSLNQSFIQLLLEEKKEMRKPVTNIVLSERNGAALPFKYNSRSSNEPAEIDGIFLEFRHNLNLIKNASESSFQKFCEKQNVHDFTISMNGSLDIFCSNVVVCGTQKCLVYTTPALYYGTIFPCNSNYASNSYDGVPICSGIEVPEKWFVRSQRRRRMPAPFPAQLRGSQPGLFNLPFHKYCGPGTDVVLEDDAGGPVGPVDEACRRHDIAYMLGHDPIAADRQLLIDVKATGSIWYPAFAIAIKAKQTFEELTGKQYNSSLYVTPPTTLATFAHFFYFKSVFDGMDSDSGQLAIIKEKEEAWKQIVLDIWRGQCFVQRRPGSDCEQDLSKQHCDINDRPSSSQSFSSNRDVSNPLNDKGDEEMATSEVDADFPQSPPDILLCRIVINEILTNDDSEAPSSFIELARVCPENFKGQMRARSLSSYYVAVIQGNEQPFLKIMIDLSKKSLQKEAETNVGADGKARPINRYYFVIGSTNVKRKDLNLYHTHGGMGGIPSGYLNGETYSVVLLHSREIRIENYKTPRPLEQSDLEIFGLAMQDIVTYGSECSAVKCAAFIAWNKGLVQLEEEKLIYPIRDRNTGVEQKSINRCAQNTLPMQQEFWEFADPSPKNHNLCPINVVPLYTFQHGSSIQSSAQFIIMNMKNFFQKYKDSNNKDLLDGTAEEITSRASGVSVSTIRRIQKRHDTKSIETPGGRKRKRVSHQICRFKEEDRKFIMKIIQDEYKCNKPPFFNDIFQKTREYLSKKPKPQPMCGVHTFRKLLHMMGFYYGRVNQLIVLLQRPDIVMKRAKYLKRMRENDREDDPKPVIYTDESWIDTHSRTGKAWVPKPGTMEHEERLKYSYQKHQTNRGSRIILLHAAGPQGLLEGSERVFEVGGSKTSEDYHDNVNHEFYFDWFRKVCELAFQRYDRGVIFVIDNAPYHTKSDAPKASARKQELLDFLLKIDNDGKLTGFKKDTKYLRSDLWQFVSQYKKENTDHYLIDRLAKEYKHEVLRLPPHQCDLNPIEQLWHLIKAYVRKNNPDQTIPSVKKAIDEYFWMYPKEEWAKLTAHTDNLRKDYWISDNLYDGFLDANEEQLNQGNPEAVDGDQIDGTHEDEDVGPIDAYMHAGTDILFDQNGDIVDEAAQTP